LPSMTMPCLGTGPNIDLADLRGVPTVLNVWAAWCTDCAHEMPLLDAAAAKAGDRVRFLGVHAFDDADHGRDSAARFPVRFPSVQDPGAHQDSVKSEMHVAGPPYTFFVRADGTVAYKQVGEIIDAQQLDQLLADHLGVRL